MSEPLLTRAEFLDGFATWFRVMAENGHDVADEAAEWSCAVDAGGLPNEGPLSSFCAVMEQRISRRLDLRIDKSSFLARRLYGRESLRTVKCPEHKGVWSGVHVHPCPYGCHHVGWLPAGAGLVDHLTRMGHGDLAEVVTGEP